uniref:Uncharacterized protein n=1 Tax=Physcomitrium patens TaxID=3218 RepID=A0A2K1KK25_PHYPA|nr:hypothetical protein PHYPA_007798 [Physcomitrium patens]
MKQAAIFAFEGAVLRIVHIDQILLPVTESRLESMHEYSLTPSSLHEAVSMRLETEKIATVLDNETG